MILLSNHAIKQKEGGQSLIGGLDVKVCRNYFGSQVNCLQRKPLLFGWTYTDSQFRDKY
jgi:5'-phosphate synthase pdxT subunit